MSADNTEPTPSSQFSVSSLISFMARPDRMLAAGFILLAFLLGVAELVDGDIWWHLKTGELIWERGEVPRTDWFTFTNPDSPWIDLHWGFQLIAVGLWTFGGAAALILAKSAVGAATFLAGLLARRREWSLWQSVVCWLPALLLYSARYLVRPDVVTGLFLAATLAILFHARRRPRLVWYLPVIQLAWVNLHGLFVLGWVVWMFFLIDAFARRWWPDCVSESEQGNNNWRAWGGVSGLMLLANLINPYGWRGLLFPLTLFTRIRGGEDREFYQQFAGEFLGMGDYFSAYGFLVIFRYFPAFIFVVLAVMALFTFVVLSSNRRFSLFRVFLLTGFGYLAWQATRNAPLFAIVSGMVICWNVGDWQSTSDRRFEFWLTRFPRFHLVVDACRLTIAGVIAMLLLAVPVDLYSWLRPLPEVHKRPRLFGLGETEHWYAHDSAKFLGRTNMPQRVVAMHLGNASTYIFHNGPKRRVFADPRLEVNTRETLERYHQVKTQLMSGPDNSAHKTLLDEVDGNISEMPALLVSVTECLPLLPNRQWRFVYYDNAAAVFLYEPQAAQLGIPLADPTNLVLYFQQREMIREEKSPRQDKQK